MSDICTIKKSTLDGIAKAIQSKTSESAKMLPSEMEGKIEALPSQPAKGLVFSEYDSDGYPHKAEFVGNWTEIPRYYCYFISIASGTLCGKITTLKIPDTVAEINDNAFWGWQSIEEFEMPNTDVMLRFSAFQNDTALKNVKFKQNVTFYGNAHFGSCRNLASVIFGADLYGAINSFGNCNAVMLYDFSHATFVPTLSTAASLGHASGCVIKVPQALLTEWQNATNWVGLTNVTWQGV